MAQGPSVSPWHIVSAAHLVGVSSDPLPNCETGDMKNAHFMNNFNDFVAFINVTCATPEACESVDKRERFEPIQVKAVSGMFLKEAFKLKHMIFKEFGSSGAVFAE
uniref:Uncharacterized protein n=1 Tax=Caenorhabditis japonica TaxID=281687 RepID=A0A8R1IH70_CAEJA